MDKNQFSELILVPALSVVGLYTPSAHALMLGTGILESDLQCVKQCGGGPALGFFQVEKNTYTDIYRYLNKYENAKLKETCMSACLYSSWPPPEVMMYNIRWAIIIARLKYYMIPKKLPEHLDAAGMANYYKKYYNTENGDADIEKAIATFESVIKLIFHQ